MYSQNVILTLNSIAQRYAPIIKQSMTTVLDRYRNTGAGVSSVDIVIISGKADAAPILEIKFADHLIYLNHRKIEWTKLPDMKSMIAWAETKRSDPAEARQLAWATAWDKKKNDTWKAKTWRKPSLSKVLKEMNELIMQEYDRAIEADFEQSIQRGAI